MRASAACSCPTSGSSDRISASFSAWLSWLRSISSVTPVLNQPPEVASTVITSTDRAALASPQVSNYAGVGSQQNLCPLKFAHRMLAAAQQRCKLRALCLVQVHSIPYVHR